MLVCCSVSKITIASVNDRLASDKSLIPGVPLVAEAISTDKRFMQYRRCVMTDIVDKAQSI